ncbi:hypothetical protein [Mycolicibacterium aubagnense]|uniref:DUF3551 domain-containing protein n=1 Tax=Mycolicibacterium aubagnense TaxID=319707 RepID=A0ABM7I8V2_9MYCO|nr:hypothetical protein [Mycolicibacterium aubagnense]TLH61086.1 hypothetical protein C1S80_16345 [Mycolicibacterium aubagnense]WGI35039.1 hypothetical protein QDT91_12255 [Mycolicibacterium aubagnense]BBX83031.1 hypothetical protein MAUB_09040 [Mycolicibacterium aubagnense]
MKTALAIAAVIALSPIGVAHATPGQCINTPWGGYCDGQADRNGIFNHCEGALGFSNCFYVRAVPTDVDPRGWVPLN